jgi:AAA family ATP:ADP antiporter
MLSLANRFLSIFWPGFKDNREFLKFLILSVCAFFLMGAHWPQRVLKDGLLIGEIGAESQPIMRIFSVLTCFIISIFYSQMVNLFRREVVLYLIVGFLASAGLMFYYFLNLYSLGTLPFSKLYLIKSFYIFDDVFTSLTIPTFWAFVNDITTPQEARKGYSMIVFGGQFGALITTIVGKTMSTSSSNNPKIVLMSAGFILIFGLLITMLMKSVGKESLKGYIPKRASHEKHEIHFLKGLMLILTSPYVSGILFLTIAPDVLTAIINFRFFKVLGLSFAGNKEGMLAFMFNYAIWVQIVTCTISFFGRFIYGLLGVSRSIILYPVFIFIFAILISFFPSLYVFTGVLILVRGFHYALNKPAREALYIPTSKDVRYKSKAWIEVFGTRIFKATGASICKLPFAISSFFLFITPILWIFVSIFVGKRYEESLKDEETVV